MIITLEGLDRTGKTTLAEALACELDAPIVPKSAPKAADPMTEYLAPLTAYRPRAGLHVILDRWHFGETVWPRVFGRPSLFEGSWRGFDYVDRAMASLGAIAVLGTGEHDSVWERIAATPGEPLADLGRGAVELAFSLFEIAAARSSMTVIRYDFEKTPLEAAIRNITKVAKRAEEAA